MNFQYILKMVYCLYEAFYGSNLLSENDQVLVYFPSNFPEICMNHVSYLNNCVTNTSCKPTTFTSFI